MHKRHSNCLFLFSLSTFFCLVLKDCDDVLKTDQNYLIPFHDIT